MTARVGFALVAGCALAASALACRAAAAPVLVVLPSPLVGLDAKLPLGLAAVGELEMVLPPSGRVDSVERIEVGVDPEGRPRRVDVAQRLALRGTGDYSFIVPAPLEDVRAGPGSDVDPGFRRTAIVWQGFATRRRVLSALARLAPDASAGALPLVLDVRTTVDRRPLVPDRRASGQLRITLRLRNTTGVSTAAFDGPVAPAEIAAVLDRLRQAVDRGKTPLQPTLKLLAPASPRQTVISAPLRVTGTLRLPAAAVEDAQAVGGRLRRSGDGAVLSFATTLGGSAPSEAVISLDARVRGAGAPKLRLAADPAAVLPELRPPRGASSWREAVSGAPRSRGRELVRTAVAALLRLARVRQYDAFLVNPDRFGSREAVYVYRTAVPAPRAAPRVQRGPGGHAALVAAAALGGLLLAGGLVVLWAHS